MKAQTLLFLTFFLVSLSATGQKVELENEIQTIESSLRNQIQIEGESPEYFSIADRMEHHNTPGLSIAVIKDGKIRWAKGYGMANTKTGTKVDTNTLFQAGSISKPIAALSSLKLVQEGKLDLDTDVNQYLTKWKIPENKFTHQERVTLRRLLTHSAGMTVHGFPGYKPDEDFPSDIDVLNGEGNTDSIRVDTTPGSLWRYSGGGYTIMENIVEDISGVPFATFMKDEVLDPLGMTNSTYEQPLPERLHNQASAAYNNEGKLIEGYWHNYPEQAAAGLWTTPSDLAKYCIEIQEIVKGKDDAVISSEIAGMMLTKHENNWGLGPSLQRDGDSLRFGHGGKNAGFTNSMTASVHQGDGLIVMTSADGGGKLISEIEEAISRYYGWKLRKPQIIEPYDLSTKELKQLKGKWKMDKEIPGIGEIIIEIKIKKKQLVIYDPLENQHYYLTPTGDFRFIAINTGDRITFLQVNSDQLNKMIWNSQYTFLKL